MNLLELVVLVLGAVLIVACAAFVVGAFVPRIPHVGAWGSLLWPTAPGAMTIVLSVALAIEILALTMTGSRTALAFVALGTLTLCGSLVILGAQIVAATRAGVPIGPGTLVAIGLGPKSKPDDEVTYASDPDGGPLRMVVYRPRGAEREEAAPIVVYVHGGGWYQGAPDENPAMLRWFADEGYLVFAPAYSLATDERPTWDVATSQVTCALAWIGEHAAEFGGDPDRIAVWGASAGGNLSLTSTFATAAGRSVSPCSTAMPRIAAAAGEVPAVDPAWVHDNPDRVWGPRTREMVERYIGGDTAVHPERLAAVQVATYLSTAAPPTLLSASRGDHLVPVGGIEQFVDDARAAGADVDVVYRRFGDHLVAAIYGGLASQKMLRQFRDHFRRHGV